MPEKNRKITDTDKIKRSRETDLSLYKLGFQDGEQQLKETVILLKKTNHQLWEELTRLDKKRTVVGVVLTFDEVRRLIRASNIAKRNTYQVGKLRGLLHKAEAEVKYIEALIQP